MKPLLILLICVVLYSNTVLILHVVASKEHTIISINTYIYHKNKEFLTGVYTLTTLLPLLQYFYNLQINDCFFKMTLNVINICFDSNYTKNTELYY